MGATHYAFRLLFASAAVAAIHAEDTLVLVHKQADSVGIYDTAKGELLASVAVGVKPHELVLSPDARLAFVTDYGVDSWTETSPGGNTVSIVDLAQGQRIGVIDLGKHRRPHGIELGSKSGLLYVTCDLPPAVVVLDVAARTVVRAISLNQQLPHMLAVNRDETTLFVANSGSASITAVDLKQQSLKNVPIGGIPMGLALSPDGRRLYAVNRSGNALIEVDATRCEVTRKLEIAGQPARVKVSPDGRQLLVSTIESGEGVVVDLSSWSVVLRVPAGAHAEGIGFEPSGRAAYITAQGDDKVHKYALPHWNRVLSISTGKRPDTPAVFWRKK